jgi:hypothetical protein
LCVVAISNCPVPAQAQGHPPAETPNRRARPFNPGQPDPFRVTKGDVEVAFVQAQRCTRCASAYQLTFDVADRARERRRRFTISDGPSQVDQIHILANDRAAILGRYQSNVDMVLIMDLNTGGTLDKWLCFDPAVSPGATFIAYRKVFPLHFTEGVSSVYLVYQTGSSPAENRAKGTGLDDITNVGVPVYPAGSTNVSGDNVNVDEAVRHEMASRGFFWGDDVRVAFADRVGAVNSIVVIDLTSGAESATARATPLETSDIISSKGCREFRDRALSQNAMHVANIAFLDSAATRLRVQFGYSLPDCHGPATLDITVR